MAKSVKRHDFISQLPDHILTIILALLPLKDSIRTGTLSSRWRNIWKLAPLHLDDHDSQTASSNNSQCPLDDMFALDPWKWNEDRELQNLPPLTRHQMSFFDPAPPPGPNLFDQPYNSRFCLLLSSHYGPVHSLRLSGVKGLAFRGTVTHLVAKVIHRGIQELTLNFQFPRFYVYFYDLPGSLFNCGSLQRLMLRNCNFPNPAPRLGFPNLKELNLRQCTGVSIDFVHAVMASCVSLETLQLVSCKASQRLGRVSVSVRSTSLRKFVLSDSRRLRIKELVIEYAPNLEYLLFSPDVMERCNVKVLHTTRLQVLGYLSVEFNKLRLGADRFVQQAMMPAQVRLSTVKTLSIDMKSIHNLDSVLTGILEHFPCIENLYLNGTLFGQVTGVAGTFWDEKRSSFPFQDHHLKQVIVHGFLADEIFMAEFVRFLIRNSKVLSKIIIIGRKDSGYAYMGNLRRRLCLEKRASQDLELVITTEPNCIDVHARLWRPLMCYEFVGV